MTLYKREEGDIIVSVAEEEESGLYCIKVWKSGEFKGSKKLTQLEEAEKLADMIADGECDV